MTSRLFRSMTPDRDSRKAKLRWNVDKVALDAGQFFGALSLEVERPSDDGATCDRCGTLYYAGDWPWCSGRPEQHRRD